jgi:hypothetical protein
MLNVGLEIDQKLRILRGFQDRDFGGLPIIIMGGDFLQIWTNPANRIAYCSDIEGGCQKQVECRRVLGTDGKAALRIEVRQTTLRGKWEPWMARANPVSSPGRVDIDQLMYCTSWVVASFPPANNPLPLLLLLLYHVMYALLDAANMSAEEQSAGVS